MSEVVVVPMGDRVCLTKAEAVAMVPQSDWIRVLSNAGNVFFDAQWERSAVLDAIERRVPEVAGPTATADGFGLVVWESGIPFFVETGVR